MTLPLMPDMLAGAYEFLRTTPPFRGWRLPPADAVEFCVNLDPRTHGQYQRGLTRQHRISVSAATVGHVARLIETVAHEMIHLHQAERGTDCKAQHNAEFHRLAKRVCRRHGFDPKAFV